MATCTRCGATVPDTKAFCQDCGAAMTPEAAAQRTPEQPGLGATVIVPPTQWPKMEDTPPAANPAPATTATPPSARPAPPPAASTDTRATTPPPTQAPASGGSRTALFVIGAIVLLLVILALVYFTR